MPFFIAKEQTQQICSRDGIKRFFISLFLLRASFFPSLRLETHFRSPQLDLWQLSDTEWLLVLRRPEPVARRNRGKVVALARQLSLPLEEADGE